MIKQEFLGHIKKDILCKGLNCAIYSVNFQVDPLIFQRYNIKDVLAIIYVKDITDNNSQSYIYYGDTALEYILEVFYKEGRVEERGCLVQPTIKSEVLE